MADEADYVDIGLLCADVCEALELGMDVKSMDDLNKLSFDAITQLSTWVELAKCIFCPSTDHRPDCRTVAEIQERVLKRSANGGSSRALRLREDKDVITAWKLDLSRISQVFNVCSMCFYFVVVNRSIFRPNWLWTLTSSLLIYIRRCQESTRTLAARIRW